MLLVTIAICAEWSSRTKAADTAASTDCDRWSAASGIAWGLAIWNSAYESLVVFLLVMVVSALENRQALLARSRRAGWLCFVLTIAIALLIERRMPSLSIFHSNAIFKNWASTIGELAHVLPANPIWLRWCGYFLLLTPVLIWITISRNRTRSERAMPWFVPVILVATYALTIWQARWGYFFVLIFALALPVLLTPINSRVAVWIAFVLSMYPILRDWDERLCRMKRQLAAHGTAYSKRRKYATSAPICNRQRRARSLRHGGFRPRLLIGAGSPESPEVRTRSLSGIEDSARFFSF
jgi:hypothetical protein